jgi:multidrug efflux pump subunit AcrB
MPSVHLIPFYRHVDRPTRPPPPLHLRRDGDAHAHPGVFTIVKMPTDIFPDIDIPVISVIFNYSGMSPDEMEKRIVTGFERTLTTTVNDIEHIESQSLYGVATVKVYFQPGTPRSSRHRPGDRHLPDGHPADAARHARRRWSSSTAPPTSPSSSSPSGSDTLPEQGMFDQAINFVRPRLVTVPGGQIPFPYGGKQRQVMVDLDPGALFAWGSRPPTFQRHRRAEPHPAGRNREDRRPRNTRHPQQQPFRADDLNGLPIKTVNGTPSTSGTWPTSATGSSPDEHRPPERQARRPPVDPEERRASTLDVVAGIKKALRWPPPRCRRA